VNKANLATYANYLNSAAAQLSVAKQNLESAMTRIEATERSLLVLQRAILKELNENSAEAKSEV